MKRINFVEKAAAPAVGLVWAVGAFILSLQISVSAHYADFVVGAITWRDESKLADIIILPLCLVVFIGVSAGLSHLISLIKARSGTFEGMQFSQLLLWWGLPGLISILSAIIDTPVDKSLLLLSGVGTLFLTCFAVRARKFERSVCEGNAGLLGVLASSSIPFALYLGWGRLNPELSLSLHARDQIAKMILAVGLGTLFYLVKWRNAYRRFVSLLLIAGQLGWGVFFCSLWPAELVEPGNKISGYSTQPALRMLILGLLLWAFVDIVGRYRKYKRTRELSDLISPVSVFALIAVFKVGVTTVPSVNPDDYHFGESLLGWKSYLNGAIPYFDYLPPHGLIDDDLRGFVSHFFFDGTASAIGEAGRVVFVLLAGIAFSALVWSTGSIAVSTLSTFLLYIGGYKFGHINHKNEPT
ncbi:MAG: hypothetical protein C5B49_02615 [Bdellovibrio sp.]|nr:MAG: hypothetical protein C5B49_02615 [Bdellovibrio sp.]